MAPISTLAHLAERALLDAILAGRADDSMAQLPVETATSLLLPTAQCPTRCGSGLLMVWMASGADELEMEASQGMAWAGSCHLTCSD